MKIDNIDMAIYRSISKYTFSDYLFDIYLDQFNNDFKVAFWKKKSILLDNIILHYNPEISESSFAGQKILRYVDLKNQGSDFPPIIVLKLDDGLFFSIDGFHRVKAALMAGEKSIEAYVGYRD